jgi:GAF domain-containing protein
MHGQLAREFAEAAQDLQELHQPDQVLNAIVELAGPAVGCRHVGVLLCARRAGSQRGPMLRRGQASDAAAAQADALQIAVRQGPCWSCLARPSGPADVVVDDTTTESRWPAWNGPLAELGLRSVLTFRLNAVGRIVGFLTWYDDAPHTFEPDTIAIAHLVAVHAAVPLLQALEGAPSASRRVRR